jgi:hypothetical protein
VDLPGRELPTIAPSARIGRKINGDATPLERNRKRLRWKQMSAGSSGGKQDHRAGSACHQATPLAGASKP